jgi:hypothetical protein
MELFQRGWKIKQKKRVPSLILFSRKSEFEFTFLLNDSSEALHLLNFLHRKYKIIYNNDIFVRKNASLNSGSNNAIILIYRRFVFCLIISKNNE